MKKILKFSAEWCVPCRMMSNTLKSMDTSKYVIEEIDIDECPDKAAEYKVRGIPTLIMVDDDIEIKRISGSKSVGELQSWMM